MTLVADLRRCGDIVFYGWARIVRIIVIWHEWIEIAIGHAILVSQIRKEFLKRIADTSRDSVRTLPIRIVR